MMILLYLLGNMENRMKYDNSKYKYRNKYTFFLIFTYNNKLESIIVLYNNFYIIQTFKNIRL